MGSGQPGIYRKAGLKEKGVEWTFPYRSQRTAVLADNMVVASPQLAARAGAMMLESGGNAVDACLAMAATLTVVEPVMNGLGGDAQVLLWDGQSVAALSGCGKSPAAWSLDRFSKLDAMPNEGW